MNELKLTGNLTHILAEEGGSSKAGKSWRKRTIIVTVPGEYPKEVALTQFGDAIDKTALVIGQTVTAHINIESREYSGKYYTDVKAWKIDIDKPSPAPAPVNTAPDDDSSDLPF